MTDRKLLELAARAAGISWKPAETDAGKMCELKFGLWLNIVQEPTESTRRRFNPLNDDGDAFRLAADLRLDVLWAEHSPSVVVNNDSWANESNLVEVRESYFHSTKYEALRRAIVRASAELAKQEVKP